MVTTLHLHDWMVGEVPHEYIDVCHSGIAVLHDGIGMLCFLIDGQGLTPSDLPEIGSEKTVSEITSGEKELSVRHVRALSERFHVSPAVFCISACSSICCYQLVKIYIWFKMIYTANWHNFTFLIPHPNP
ncbi:MAG: hypothetical protein WCR46_12910, partial [Deltaproteobacteria bacterium]